MTALGDLIKQKNQSTPVSTSLTSSKPKTKLGSLLSTSNKPIPKTADLTSSAGLYNKAVESGLQTQADRIMQGQKGEDPGQIFSGGTISDIFDVLNTLDYGVVGMFQGKGFKEGVKTRASFTDTLSDKGWTGLIGGTLLDIAVDPLTYVAPYTIAKKIPGLSKLAKLGKTQIFGKTVTKAVDAKRTYETLDGGTKVGRYLANKFKYMNGVDPVFRKTYEEGILQTSISTQKIAKLVNNFVDVPEDVAKQLLKRGADGRISRVALDSLKLDPNAFSKASNIYKAIDDLGAEAVDLGFLTKTKFEENVGEYLKNAYTEYEKAGKFFGKVKSVGIKGGKKRVADLTPEAMAKLGQIDNPAYLFAKTGIDLARDVENAKLLKAVNKSWGTDVAQEGFTKITDSKRWGSLAGKYIPDNMASNLNHIIEKPVSNLGTKAVSAFKFNKVLLNPATHARNLMSNQILNYWKLGMNPLDPRVIKANATALKEIAKGGGKYADEAKKFGYGLDTFIANEFRSLLDAPELTKFGKLGKGANALKKKVGNLYEGEENLAKLSAYIFNKTVKNLDPKDAWKAAESATFNYAQVTPFIRKLRTNLFGVPFITFTAKSTPLALETLAKNPNRISVFGKAKKAIENKSDQDELKAERGSESPWIKDGFYVKLPMKDKLGRSAYFDLTYIMPFGDIVAGGMFNRGSDTDTGTKESLASAALGKSPMLNLVKELGTNQDFYGNSIWKDSDSADKQMKDLTQHIVKLMAPPMVADQIPGGYKRDGTRQVKGLKGALTASDQNQQRSLMQEMARMVGMKVQPMSSDIQEKYSEWNKIKGLQTLLLENPEQSGIDEFNRLYERK